MYRIVAVLTSLLVAGCQTWGSTWSEVSGSRYPSAAEHQFRRPAIVEHIDAQGAFVSDPIRIQPGTHRVELSAPVPGWRGGSDIKVLMLDAAPCKLYYINAQFENNVSQNWMPVIDYVQDIAGCKTDGTG